MSEKPKEPEADDKHELEWQIRTFIYKYMVDQEHFPTANQTAQGLGIAKERIEKTYRWLHDKHALFLEPNDPEFSIRIANPFSGVPTSFQTKANDHSYWANCAWDCFGILVALHTDGKIEATYASDNQPLSISVEKGQVLEDNAVVHFLLPFEQWYHDLIYT